MIPNNHLISFHILERDHNKNLVTWSYPTITDEIRNQLITKCFSIEKNAYFCFRKQKTWFYIQQVADENQFAIAIIAQDCDIPKYKMFSVNLAKSYLKTRNPVDLVKLYLSAFAAGTCSLQEKGDLISCDFRNVKCDSNVKGLIKQFGVEIILIYTAILLKRRILVYHEDIEILQRDIMDMMLLVKRRNLDEYLQPLVQNATSELKGYSFFLSGVQDPQLINKTNIYDIFVNLDNSEIFISPQSNDIFAMTKLQKEIAEFLTQSTEDLTERELLNKLNVKTETLVSNLKSIGTFTAQNSVKMVTLNDLRSKSYKKSLENFLFNLATAENIMIM